MHGLLDGTKHRTVVFLPSGLKAATQAVADANGVSFGAVVRDALDHWVPNAIRPAASPGEAAEILSLYYGAGSTYAEICRSTGIALSVIGEVIRGTTRDAWATMQLPRATPSKAERAGGDAAEPSRADGDRLPPAPRSEPSSETHHCPECGHLWDDHVRLGGCAAGDCHCDRARPEPVASPEAEPRCDLCQWWRTKSPTPYPEYGICGNRRSDLYEQPTSRSGSCPSFRRA